MRASPNSARAHLFYVTALYDGKYKISQDAAEKKQLVDTMDVHLRKAIEIHPNYAAAWYMRAAVAAARFDMDHQMDRLFNEFDGALEKIPYHTDLRKFIDSYVKYLATNGGNPNKVCTFCYREGYEYFYQKKKDYNSAIQFLENGLLNQTEDERILTALAEVYRAAGNPAKAAEMEARNKMYNQ